jgi:hypothetical protein
MKHVVSIGGGIASTLLLPLWLSAHYRQSEIELVMARLPNEDGDVWRLCDAVTDITGLPVKYIGLDKTPWEVFHKSRFIGNTLVDPCSDQLKRQVMREYIASTYNPGEVVLYVGIGAHEIDRHMTIKKRWSAEGYEVRFPMMDYPEITREWSIRFCRNMVGFVPKLYEMGFEHNNCGGGCVKAGHKQWAKLLWYSRMGILKTHEGIPTYQWWRENEELFRQTVGEYTILRDWKKPNKGKPMTLVEFERRMDERWGKWLPGMVGLMAGYDFEASLSDLDDTSGCSFCDAVA